MTKFKFFLLIGVAACVFAGDVSHAQEKTKEAPKAKTESVVRKAADPDAPQPGTPLAKWIDAENALIAKLSAKDQESFFIMRNKHSIIRAVEVVERDVGAAVKSCGKANPDMKEKMTSRFDQWKDAVDPILDTARKSLEREIAEQKIVDVGAAKNVLKLNDAAYKDGEKNMKKVPISTKEACEGLLASMNRTEDDMVTLLQQTLLPESVIRKRSDDADKAEGKKKEASKPEEKKKAE